MGLETEAVDGQNAPKAPDTVSIFEMSAQNLRLANLTDLTIKPEN
jgi:hypothetical protein